MPQWRKRPTEPGIYVCYPGMSGSKIYLPAVELDQDDIDNGAPHAARWCYGPIKPPEEDDKLLTEVIQALKDVEQRLAKGKGEWPKPGYVRDEVWAGWRGERYALRSVLSNSGIDLDEVI
jgi:hypothetical protein